MSRASGDRPKGRLAGWAIGLLWLLSFLEGSAVAALVGTIAAYAFRWGGNDPWLTDFGLVGTLVLSIPTLWLLKKHPISAPAAALVGVVVSTVVYHFTSDPRANALWIAERDRPSNVAAVGSWISDGIVIRARPETVIGYRVSDGHTAWQWSPPGQATVCAMSENTAQGVGLIGYGLTDEPCGEVTALNLATGKPLWTQSLNSARRRTGDEAEAGIVAIAGDTAIIEEEDGWRGLSLAGGEPRWQAKTDDSCSPAYLAGGRNAVATIADCPGRAPVLRTFAPANGQAIMRSVLPGVGGRTRTAVISTAPIAVWVDDQSTRGTHAVLSYDQQGKLRATIPVFGPHYNLDVAIFNSTLDSLPFPARPDWGAVVVGDLLIAPAETPDDEQVSRGRGGGISYDGRLVAYSLADGRHKWTKELGERVIGLAVDGTGVWAQGEDKIVRIDAATGRELITTDTDNVEGQFDPVGLWVAGRRFICVAEDGSDLNAPVLVLG